LANKDLKYLYPHLRGKKILLGVAGSIAAIKAPIMARLLTKAGAEVRVVLTQGGAQFTTPLAMSVASGQPCITSFTSEDGVTWENHVHHGLWADAVVIAPASANTIANLANGSCSNILEAIYLSRRCPAFVSPAMDHDMWRSPSVQRNVTQLEADGVMIWQPETGALASGLEGEGRMPEPETLLGLLNRAFTPILNLLKGKSVLITAGPTHEPIDPVRFIGNRSSGKMGYAISEACLAAGADVTLITGPVKINIPHGVKIFEVQTADDMMEEVRRQWKSADIGIFSAAVADYKAALVSEVKLKKANGLTMIKLEENPDILAWAGAFKEHRLLVGFALETSDDKSEVTRKMHAKHTDFHVLNVLSQKNPVFGADTNSVEIFTKLDDEVQVVATFEQSSKIDVAEKLVEILAERLASLPL
jgi:phosphopantothenoylcysteine decarboxylase / phosphopantothenate---cysteine ligase